MAEPKQETPITYEMLRKEWGWANDVLDRAGVPVSSPSSVGGGAWTLASRVEWLAKQQSEARNLAIDLRAILDRYERENSTPRLNHP